MFERLTLLVNHVKDYTRGNNPIIRYIHIETSNECNFRCVLCPLTIERGKRPVSPETLTKKMMSFDQFKTILDKIPLSNVESASLQGFGEVMLNPDFIPMARYAKSKNIHISFNSNASLLNEERSKKLIEIGIDELDFSIDSADENVFGRLP